MNFLRTRSRRDNVLRSKEPENGDEKAVKTAKPKGSSAKVAWCSHVWAFGGLGNFQAF